MIFSHFQTRQLVKKNTPSVMPLSTDLGLTVVEVRKTQGGWQLPDGNILTYSQIDTINKDENSCFHLVNGELQKIEAFSARTNRYYSLLPTSGAPSMLVSGIPMHRIKGTTPDQDTERKIQALGKPFGLILDTAMGLGYTAIRAARTAAQVITIELDPAVILICKANPWSQGLFTNPKIHKIIGNTADIAPLFQDGIFNAIIHDPPMFNLGGYLYSGEIYETFYRILRPNGRMFHYIGNPESRTGASVGKGVMNRLRQVGFTVTPKPNAFGVLAKKQS